MNDIETRISMGQVTYNEVALEEAGFAKGEISSFMIPENMTVDLYTGYEKTGEKRSFVGGDYMDTNQRMFCQEVLDTDFKEKVVTVVVGNAKSQWKANGSWE